MPSLSPSLSKRCYALLAQCGEFGSMELLRAVFVTEALKPFQAGLPEGDSVETRVRLVVAYLLDKRLTDGRAPLVVLLGELQERYSAEALGQDLAKLKADVQAYLETRADAATTKRKKRRIDAALPAQAELNQHIDLVVQVRFPSSKPLSIADWPVKHRPDALETQQSTVALDFPVDERTGEPRAIVLQLRLNAPDFTVEGEALKQVEVLPNKFSEKVLFLLTPLHAGACRVNVEVQSTEAVYLGALPLEMQVGETTTLKPTATIASLVLTVDVKAETPLDPRRYVKLVNIKHTSAPQEVSVKLNSTLAQVEALCKDLEGARRPTLTVKTLTHATRLTEQLRRLIGESQMMVRTSTAGAERAALLRQVAAASKRLDAFSQLLPSGRANPLGAELPRSGRGLTQSLVGLSTRLTKLKIPK